MSRASLAVERKQKGSLKKKKEGKGGNNIKG